MALLAPTLDSVQFERQFLGLGTCFPSENVLEEWLISQASLQGLAKLTGGPVL